MNLVSNMQQNFPVSTGFQGGDLSSYLTSVNAQPILTAEQERELATRYHEDSDLESAQQLVLSHLRFVVRIARGFAGYGIPLGDLIQEGNVGLMKAVKRYEPNRNVRLVSFAVHWIKAEIYDFILKNWKIVRIATTKAHRKLFFNLRKHRSSLEAMSETEIEKLSSDLDVPVETVREMEVRMNGTAVSFDGNPDDSDSDESFSAPAAYLGDMRYNPEHVYESDLEQTQRSEQLEQALEKLDERSRDIIVKRWLGDSKLTLQDLASMYGVSAERIRQLEEKAMRVMREHISNAEPGY
ncbi:MAG: RNA polymerase sigma factor RpoH [Acidiferrobacterales bacterium]|nr:RNA polymerase sigma factor RpoH [Acidiferrobacterales bacterium]